MLHRTAEILSEDFPELVVKLTVPTVDGWDAYQKMRGDGNGDEASLNLLIECGSIQMVKEGAKAPTFGTLCDEWPSLPELAIGELSIMAGVFGCGINATRLDLPAVLAACERVAKWTAAVGADHDAFVRAEAPTPDDLALAKLAEEAATFGLNAETMRTVIGCNPRRGSYTAILFHGVAALVLRRPRFSTWSAYNGARRASLQQASTSFAVACADFPAAGVLADMIAKLPGLAVSCSSECVGLYGDVRADVKKGVTGSV